MKSSVQIKCFDKPNKSNKKAAITACSECDTHICPSGAYVEPVIENSWMLQREFSTLSAINIWMKENQKVNYTQVHTFGSHKKV